MSRSVIVSGARTPMGRLLGSLKDFSAADLGGVAIKAALERAGISGDQVDYVIMGQVLQAGAGQNPARPAAVAAGIPMSVPSFTLNKVCLSGLDAIALADQLIRAGEFDIVVAGGMESMTQAPHLLANSRTGTKYGDTKLIDSMAHDGLSDTFDQVAMGELTEQANSRYDLTREEQDAFAARRTRRPPPPQKNGLFDDEITPVLIPQRKGDPIEFRDDEGIRADTTAESLSKLKPAFAKDGTITAGTASQISDGACAVVVMSAEKAAELGLTPLAEIGAHGVVAGPDATLQSQPSRAIAKACEREGIDPKDLDLVELNEAFAAVGIVSTRELGVDPEKVNVNGGAIALGHPVGMSGARIVLHAGARARPPRRRRRRRRAVRRRRSGRRPDPARARSRDGRHRGPDAAPPPRGRRGRRAADVPALVERRPRGRRPLGRPADLAGRGRQPGAARGGGRAGAAHRARAGPRAHRLARRRQVDDDDGAGAGAPRATASGSACSPSTRPRRSPAVRCSATASGCRTTPATAASTSGRWPPAGTSAGWPGRRRRRCACSTPPAATSS